MFQMIHCNLATLLAQRHMKIAKIHQDTRISRTTLTSLAYGHAQGIQFDTLNTLCTYLNVSAADMILHLPIDIIWEKKVYSESSHVRYDTVILTIKERGKEKHHPLCMETRNYEDDGTKYSVSLTFTAPADEPDMPVASEEEVKACKEIIAALPVEFATDVSRDMMSTLSPVDPVDAENEAEVLFESPFPSLNY